MRIIVSVLFMLVATQAVAQVSSASQKSLNAYAAYANRSGEEVSDVVETMFKQYDVLVGKYPERARYTCPFQMDEYFLNSIKDLPKNSPVTTELKKIFPFLLMAEKKVDEKCKALETYYRLEDYKRDNYQQARQTIEELQPLVTEYSKVYNALLSELQNAYKKNQGATAGVYGSVDARLLNIITLERNFLNTWKLNFHASSYSGWSAEKLQTSISESVAQLELLRGQKPELKYPASSMWEHFKGVYADYIEAKRRALDEHNFEASKNDHHNNEVYLNFINYFNGTLVADYNTFLQFSERDGYYGVLTLKYVPGFDILKQSEQVSVEVKTFEDLPFEAIKTTSQKTAIPKNVFDALTEYIDFINETWRQTRSLQSTLTSFNSSATTFKTLESYERRQPMHFDYSDFKVPYSYQQKVVAASKAFPAQYSKSLNTQAEVIMNVLKEMNNLGASLDIEVKERRYEKDRLAKVYQILERQSELFTIWDEKKERLYKDVRSIYDSYTATNPSASWQKSGKVLRELTDLDHDAVFEAKKYYGGDSTIKIDAEKIEARAREVIAKEFDNMQGIQKLGRYNGNCPYSPYEDVASTSRQLVEHFQKLSPRHANTSRYNDPYYRIIYLYNEIVDDYNKFCELSTNVPHLKKIFQPEIFKVAYPDPAKAKKPVTKTPPQTSNEQTPVVKASQTVDQKATSTQTSTSTHTRDTIYIEKRDTVYIREPNEELRSMEGYATNNMVLLLDISGSMNQPEKLPLLKESMLRMLEMMRQEDQVSIIGFSGKPKILLKPTSFKEEEKIRKAVSDLTSSGKTDGKAAIRMAYKVANDNYIRGGNNRIILATDGEFAMDDDTRKVIEEFSGQDIFLSVFNFGKGMGSSKTLENLATLGKGNYEAISKENVDAKLIREAKAKRKK
ncbi:MAG TPA: VWA domain-containing protein [Chryseosolibacter sp.]